MCGIAGALSLNGAPLDWRRLKPMLDAVAHRGPDDAGYLVWHTGRTHSRTGSYGHAFTDSRFSYLSPLLPAIDSTAGAEALDAGHWDLFLGHRRLSIIDLSPRGHQPMADRAQRLWIAYNGEVYNFRELRGELTAKGYEFRSDSDTEVVLHAYAEWGPDCVRRFNGMFALAIWDVDRQRLFLARDRYGIKPLYYRLRDDLLAFGSEIKSILPLLDGAPRVDLLALNEYFSFQNVFSDRTLFADIRLLPPGSMLLVDLHGGTVRTERYWDFDFSSVRDRREEELEEHLVGLIENAVRRQCVSDVPLGSYLSGGMDSGTVAAVASRVLGRISTFTAGFDLSEAADHELTFDERELAERMASALQTEHYEVVLHSGDMEACIDWLVRHLEDLRIGQCYPNALVARLAGKFVKVVTSGAGGDELFGGYPWRYAAAIAQNGRGYIDNYYSYWKRLVADEDKARLFTPEILDGLHGLLGSGKTALGDHTRGVFRNVFAGPVETHDVTEQVAHSLYFECKTFLHGLLVVEDKLSMAQSLETRVPFLDNDLVDFACSIPVWHKLADLSHLKPIDENMPRKKNYYDHLQPGTGKTILRAAMERILPPQVTQARKQGFSAPDESWFRGRSADFVRERLLDRGQALHRFVDRGYIETALDDHWSGRNNKRLLIWSLLSFESWLRQFGTVAE